MEENGKRESIFRKKNIDRINSPEQLNDYMHVASPGVWIVLITIIVFLAGTFVWGIYGHLDTVEECPMKVSDGTPLLLISEYRLSTFHEGMMVMLDDMKGTIGVVNETPVPVETLFNNYQMHVNDLWEGIYVYTAPVIGMKGLNNGMYTVSVLTESESPFNLIFK